VGVRRLGFLGTIAAFVAACGGVTPLPTVSVAPPPEDTAEVVPNEQMAAYASVRVDGDPSVATAPFRLGIRQGTFREAVTIAVNERIYHEFGVGEGAFTLTVDDDRCVLPVHLAPETETDVLLRFADDGTCAMAVARQHPFAQAHGSAMGSVSAQVPEGIGPGVITMDLRSLDDPPNPVPPPDEVDESGLLILFDVPTGAYEARLLVDGSPIATARVSVDAHGRSDPIRFVPSG
jgi:hypothetical protein